MDGRILTTLLLAFVALSTAPGVAAAADPPDPGVTQSFEFDSGGVAFSYLVYTPSSYSRARPVPLLVMTHGCQTTAEQQMRANLYNQLAEREGFVVMYPDIDESGTMQPGPTRNCWRFPSPQSWHRDGGDAAAIAGMTRATIDRFHTDPERTYLMGMSAGGFMTSILAAAYPDLYAAVGIAAAGAYADSGCLFGNPGAPVEASAQLARDEMGSRARIVPRIVMGGDADAGISPACADKALEQGLRTNNLVLGDSQDGPIALTPASVREEAAPPGHYGSTVSTYRDPAGCLIGERWLIHGMNHFWPGGSNDPKWANWTDPKGPSGAEISWHFFARYTRSDTAMPCAEAPRASAPAGPRCRAHWLRLPFRARSIRAKVNGRRVTARVVRGKPLVRLPGGRRARTVVSMSGRKASGRRFSTRRVYEGCGP